MPLLDTIQNAALKVLPEKKHSLPTQTSNAGIGSGGVVPFDDDVSISVIPMHYDVLSSSPRRLCILHRPFAWYLIWRAPFSANLPCSGTAAFRSAGRTMNCCGHVNYVRFMFLEPHPRHVHGTGHRSRRLPSVLAIHTDLVYNMDLGSSSAFTCSVRQ